MSNDSARLMNDVHTVVSILSPEIDEIKMMLRLEEILSNFEIKRKTELELEDDMPEKVNLFLSAKKLEGLSIITLDGYLIELKLFSKAVKKAVVQINTSDIRMYLASNSNLMNSTIDRKLSVLRSFFGWLVQEELLLHNPSTKIKAPKKPKRLPKSLNIEELEIVRESCVSLRERALMEVMYSTGCRLSEIANLKVDDLNRQDMSANVVGKGNKERTVYFSYKAIHHLNKYLISRKGNCEYLFSTERRPFKNMTGRTIERTIDMIEKRTNLKKKLTPHVFRHTFAQLAMERGAELSDVQHLLGHDRPETTLVYAHVSEERKKQAHKRYHVQ